MDRDQRRRKWMVATAVMASGLLALLATELGLRLYRGERPIVTYTIQRNSSYFSPKLDTKSPLFYTHSGIAVDASHVIVHYPDGKQRTFQFARPADTFRVVAVGDSLTELWNLPGFVNYTSFLEAAVNERLHASTSEVVPLGVGGFNSWQEMHWYQQNFQQLEADVLLLQCCPNDGDVMTLRPRPAGQPVPDNEWPQYEIVGQRFGLPDFDRYRIGPLQSRIWWLLAGQVVPSRELHGYVQIAGSGEQREAIRWFRNLARSKQIPLFAVLFPMFVDGYSQPELEQVKSLLDEAEVPYLDLLPEFSKAGPLSTWARDSYHPNDAGHELAARAILHFLESKDCFTQRPTRRHD